MVIGGKGSYHTLVPKKNKYLHVMYVTASIVESSEFIWVQATLLSIHYLRQNSFLKFWNAVEQACFVT